MGNEIEWIAQRTLDHAAVGHHFGASRHAKAAGAQQRARWQADETVAAKALTAYHRFEQKLLAPPYSAWASLRYSDKGVSRSANAWSINGMRLYPLRHEAVEFKFGHHRKTFHLQGLLPSNQDVAVSHACTALATIRKNNACQRQLRETR